MANKDIEIALMVLGRYAHLPRSAAVKAVVEETGFTHSGVSGMVTRAVKSVEGHTAIMAYKQANAPAKSPNQQKITAIVDRSKDALEHHRTKLDSTKSYSAVFISDMHVPKADTSVLRLFYEVLADVPNVAYISALNDALDFPKLSKYPERRPISEQMIDGDIDTAVSIYLSHVEFIQRHYPEALQVAIVGNHDLRVSTHGTDIGTNWQLTADTMAKLYQSGVVWPDDLTRPNVFFVNKGLAWIHGWFASSNRITNLVKNYAQMLRQTRIRHLPDMVMGHTHDLLETRHHTARLYNAGCMCDMNPAYMNYAPNWKWGFSVSEFEPNGEQSRTQLVEITEENGRLFALYNGKRYTVPYTGA